MEQLQNGNYIITIDTGTTNTRMMLWQNSKKLSEYKASVGVRDTSIEGNNQKLKNAIRQGFQTLLSQNNLQEQDIDTVLASGMITSEVGLCEIPHLTAPVSVDALAAGIQPVLLPDVFSKPISFIPGIKNTNKTVTLENFERMDIMRGEETEAVSVMGSLNAPHGCIVVLPGSHSKFVHIDDKGQITGCLTSMAGELLSVLTCNTILADSVQKHFTLPEEYNREAVHLGYQTAKDIGVTRAAFSGRILNRFGGADYVYLSNYLMGVALSGDAQALKSSSALSATPQTSIVICGKDPLRQALADILRWDGYYQDIQLFAPQNDAPLSAMGALMLNERSKK